MRIPVKWTHSSNIDNPSAAKQDGLLIQVDSSSGGSVYGYVVGGDGEVHHIHYNQFRVKMDRPFSKTL